MKKNLLAVGAAIAIGIVVIFAPILVLTNFFGGAVNDSESSVFGSGDKSLVQRIGEAAKTYGETDANLVPLSTSLFQVAIVVAVSLLVALSLMLYFRKRINAAQ